MMFYKSPKDVSFYNNRASVRQKQGLSDSAPEPEPLALKDFKLKATLGRGAFGKVG